MDSRQHVEDWLQHSRAIVQDVLPALLDERDEFMRRALDAEAEVGRLAERAAALAEELAHAKNEHELLLRRQTEIAENLGRAMTHLTEVFEPIKSLAQGHREAEHTAAVD